MVKNTFLISSLFFFIIACDKKIEQKDTEFASTELKSDSISGEDENAGYEMNADVTASENYESFIPNGYELLQKAEGDINSDGTSDMVLVVKSQQEKEDEMPEVDVPGRILLLLVKDKTGKYSKAAENTQAILGKNEGGASSDDPFDNVTVKPGKFAINHMGGASERWNYENVFSYDKAANAWFMTEKNTVTFNTMNPEVENMKNESPKDFGKINFVDFKGN